MTNCFIKRCVMDDLVGKTVESVYVSSDQTVLVVLHDEGFSVYNCYGDCGSATWIADLVGVTSLLGHVVASAEEIDIDVVNDGRSSQGEDCFYGIKLKTSGGYVDIIYRNNSNGFYGGSLERLTDAELPELGAMIKVEDDYSA